MNRRGFLGALAGAVMASALELGLGPVKPLADMSFEAQLAAMVANLRASMMDVWEERDRSQYEKLEGHEVIYDKTTP